jgi:hypothetical protein
MKESGMLIPGAMPSRSNLANAGLELRHIQLELEHNRFEHMRHFIDQYYCYRKGITKRTGRAKWESIVWTGVVSVAARAKYPDRQAVVKEHAVPLKEIISMLRLLAAERRTSLEDIAELLTQFTVFGTITREEDAKLRASGLVSAMPEGFYVPGHAYYYDPLARYRHIGFLLESDFLSLGNKVEA